MKTLHRLLAATVLTLLAPFLLVVPAHADEPDSGAGQPSSQSQPQTCTAETPESCVPQTCIDAPETCHQPEPASCTPTVEQTANDYRAQVVVLTAHVEAQKQRADHAQRLADRRAATIQRLRARIRALR